MIRTLISLDPKDKRWLDSFSQRHGQSAAETVRYAIRKLQEADEHGERDEILESTGGLWRDRNEDAVAYVESIREEW